MQQFSATVSNTTSQSVTWAVSGGAANGTIDQTGLYTAPATLPNPNSPIMVTATSTATTTPGSATVNLKAPTPSGQRHRNSQRDGRSCDQNDDVHFDRELVRERTELLE